MTSLQSRKNILLIFGMTSVALLFSTSSFQMISASVEGGTPSSNASKSNQSAAVAGPEEGHIIPPTNAEQSQGNQSAVEGCSPMDPRCNTDISCEEDPYKCVGQSQGGSQGVAPGSNTSNSNQGTAEGPNPCISDPNRCKPTNNAGQSQGGSQGTVPDSSSSSGTSSNANQQAINHINQAQSALQNGDTAGAQSHLDLAKQSLHCEGCEPTN
jgi:hypothetical protein